MFFLIRTLLFMQLSISTTLANDDPCSPGSLVKRILNKISGESKPPNKTIQKAERLSSPPPSKVTQHLKNSIVEPGNFKGKVIANSESKGGNRRVLRRDGVFISDDRDTREYRLNKMKLEQTPNKDRYDKLVEGEIIVDGRKFGQDEFFFYNITRDKSGRAILTPTTECKSCHYFRPSEAIDPSGLGDEFLNSFDYSDIPTDPQMTNQYLRSLQNN